MKKKYLNLALALTIVAGLFNFNLNANAATNEDPTLNWTVSYDGSSLKSDYSYIAAKSQISSAMPGDTITYNITYANNSSKSADFYMKSDVISSLESTEGTSASGGAYSYTVLYNSGSGDTTIYDSATLGGSNTDVVGLMQAAATNDSYFYVGNLSSGSAGVVTIKITLDGNSQTNSYMSTLASLGIQFGVEDSTVTNTVTRNIVYEIPGGTSIIEIIDDTLVPLAGPKTGDSIVLLVICAVALFAGLGLIGWYFSLTKKKEEEGQADV